MKLPYKDAAYIAVRSHPNQLTTDPQPLMTAASNHGRFFQLKFFNRLSIKSVTIYRPNESIIYVFNGNGNSSILANGGLTYYRTGGTKWRNATTGLSFYCKRNKNRDQKEPIENKGTERPKTTEPSEYKHH